MKHLRPLFSALAFATAVSSLLSPALGQETAPVGDPRPNILLIVADDHGQDLGAYGNPVIRTPNLDALAAEGVLFTHAFATTASCSASRSVILSGLHNHRTGQYGHTHDYHHFASFDHLRSLPNLLREGGYRTGIIGKYHVEPRAAFEFETVLRGAGRDDVEMAERTREFLAGEDERPFFLYFATHDPHRGGKRRSDGTEATSEDLTTPDNFGNRPKGYEGVEDITFDPAEVIVPGFLPDSDAARAELVEYYRSVSRLDQGVGRLLELLKETGGADDTFVVYLSDHGIAFPGAKTTTYEPGLRSPLIVRDPRLERRGLVNSAMISWVDITPTLLEVAGVEAPVYDLQVKVGRLADQMPARHGLHGRSFLSILESPEPEGWDEVYASHTFHEIQMYYPMRVVRERRYKLIWNLAHPLPFPFATDLWDSTTWQTAYQQGPEARYGARSVREYLHRPKYELYDLQADPLESTNLADDPAHQKILARLEAKLFAFQRRTADPWSMKQLYE